MRSSESGTSSGDVLGYSLQRDVATIARAAAKKAGARFLGTKVVTDILAVPYVLLLATFLGSKKTISALCTKTWRR